MIVIVPEGISPGEVINVSSDGHLFACTIPENMTVGSKFIVEVKDQPQSAPVKAIPY